LSSNRAGEQRDLGLRQRLGDSADGRRRHKHIAQIVEPYLMEVGHEGVIAGGEQQVEHPGGQVDLTMRGGDRARLENVKQFVTNTRTQPAVAPSLTCPDCGAPVREGQSTCVRCGLRLPGIKTADPL
jgi:hypothetical protein